MKAALIFTQSVTTYFFVSILVKHAWSGPLPEETTKAETAHVWLRAMFLCALFAVNSIVTAIALFGLPE